jgi:hypothetical protein
MDFRRDVDAVWRRQIVCQRHYAVDMVAAAMLSNAGDRALD